MESYHRIKPRHHRGMSHRMALNPGAEIGPHYCAAVCSSNSSRRPTDDQLGAKLGKPGVRHRSTPRPEAAAGYQDSLVGEKVLFGNMAFPSFARRPITVIARSTLRRSNTSLPWG